MTIDVVLCWGWIDAIRKGHDEKSFLQRYTRRGKKSIWSQINVDNVARLIKEGRMTRHGLDEVEAHVGMARAEGSHGEGQQPRAGGWKRPHTQMPGAQTGQIVQFGT